jgi:hypothetical protein
MTESPGVWQLRYDVLSVRVLAAVAIARGAGTLKPEVHLFLGDRYDRLADHYGRLGAGRRARRLAAKARWHYAQAGFDDFPRAAAIAMPLPRPGLFTNARARDPRRHGPDTAA